MAVCSQCNGETPEGTTFCVNCGAKMPASGAQQTQFGMPLLKAPPAQPASERGAPATTQFGPEEIAALASAAKEAGLEPEEAPKPSLMAGLPRPPVSSAPSPLTSSAGLKSQVTPRPISLAPARVSAPPAAQGAPAGGAARRTVMGMPLMGPGASVPPPAASPSPASAVPASVSSPPGASAILSLEAFDQEILTSAPPTPAPLPAARAPSAAPDLEATPIPSVRISRQPMPAQDTEPVGRDEPAAPLQAPKTSLLPIALAVVIVAAGVAALLIFKL